MSMAPSSDIEDAEDADTDYVSHNEFPVTSQYPDLEYVPISPWPEGLPENAKESQDDDQSSDTTFRSNSRSVSPDKTDDATSDEEYHFTEVVHEEDSLSETDSEHDPASPEAPRGSRLDLIAEEATRHPYLTRSDQTGGRFTRSRGLGRGGKGIKRGPRKVLEPNVKFKHLHGQATDAFIAQDYANAEVLAFEAMVVNPEIYKTYSLLSLINMARGEKDKALIALFAGAHTKPRAPDVWRNIADLVLKNDAGDRMAAVQEAIYCYNRMISLDKTDTLARSERAALNRERGHRGKAAADYEEWLKQRPHNTEVLRHLADVYIDLDEADKALRRYDDSIAYYKEHGQLSTAFTWSDVNIYAELLDHAKRYDNGLIKLKSLSRWILGRADDEMWDAFNEDDREWDFEHQPRRSDTPGFRPEQYDLASYGASLPFELRVKLGVFRLKSAQPNVDEAMNHFNWLIPIDQQDYNDLADYRDLFREIADTLRESGCFDLALKFYKPLESFLEEPDTSFFVDIARCYEATGSHDQAEECYESAVKADPNNVDALVQLAKIYEGRGNLEEARKLYSQIAEIKESVSADYRRTRRGTERKDRGTRPLRRLAAYLSPRQKQHHEQQNTKGKLTQKEHIQEIYLRMQSIKNQARSGELQSRREWMANAKLLTEDFMSNKVFFPPEKHMMFFGYSREAWQMSQKPKNTRPTLGVGLSDGHSRLSAAGIPKQYQGIRFEDWLDVFLEFCLMLAQDENVEFAYLILTSVDEANVFHHSNEMAFLIHVCWFSCALIANDDETSCSIARWFVKEYQFVTDSYRLFSALNRFCDCDNSWFNAGPTQKYVLRQLKAVDFSLIEEVHHKRHFQERASFTTKDPQGNAIKAEDMDVALLMLYGHILYAGGSYAQAINYFLRALALDPENPLINFSLALSYLFYALKRQSDNRHHLVMQSMSFLSTYYDMRHTSNEVSDRQEAAFNVARAHHTLGLTHLAVPYYQQCLDMSTEFCMVDSPCNEENFLREAAIALQAIWASNGDMESARKVTEQWLVF